MNSKELIKNSLNHKPIDRIPVDFGATAVTGMHVSCVAALRKYFGLEDRPVKISDPYQMLGELDNELKEIIGIDTVAVVPRNTMFGFPAEGWKEWRMPDGLVVMVPGGFRTTTDMHGDIYIYPGGDIEAGPSGKMPKAGYFFDTIIRQQPINESALNPNDNLEEFTEISEGELDYFERELAAASQSGKAVVATFGGMAFGDIALVPAPFLKQPKGIRDISEWYMSTLMRPDYIHRVFEAQCEIALRNLGKINARAGRYVDIVFICGTDFGTQDSAFCSVGTFNDLYLPYYKKINNWIHRNTEWKTFKHSCGAVWQFIGPFIEAGFDILNPVQCSAAGMNPSHLKQTYGDRISFWGGGADTQGTLPFGSRQQVYDETIHRCRIFSGNGGFVFNSVHNIQAKTPVENIIAMIEAVKDFNV